MNARGLQGTAAERVERVCLKAEGWLAGLNDQHDARNYQQRGRTLIAELRSWVGLTAHSDGRIETLVKTMQKHVGV